MTTTTTDTVWREIDGWLLGVALHEAFGFIVTGHNDGTQDVSEDLIREIVAHLEEGDLMCDHSVNVCACGARLVHEDLTLWLNHKRTCRECGGDGIGDFITRHVTDEDEPIPCTPCGGKGTVAL